MGLSPCVTPDSLQRAGPESLDCPDEPLLGAQEPYLNTNSLSSPTVVLQCLVCSIPAAGVGNSFFVRRTLVASQLRYCFHVTLFI